MNAADERREYLCIGCPLGCRLEVEQDASGQVEVRGNSCKRGLEFARQEHTDPRRMVATTVRVEGGAWARLPVRTRDAVPKAQVLPLCRALHALTLAAPVTRGDVVLEDALGTEIDVIASRDLAPRG
jgi:CxxC motif-containing protein